MASNATRRVARFCAVALAAVTATPSMGEAQQAASSLDQLRVVLKPEEKVTVTDGAFQDVSGRVVGISPSSLELLVAGKRRTFQEGDIRTIRRRRPDPLWNGALWGLVAGGAAATVVVGYLTAIDAAPSREEGLTAFGLFAGIGTGAGLGVDAMVSRTTILYAKPRGSPGTLTLAPVLTRGSKGIRVSVGF